MRIKTAFEMEEEFGGDWRRDAFPAIGWNDDMDQFFGQEFPISKAQELAEMSSGEIEWHGHTWIAKMLVGITPAGRASAPKSTSSARMKLREEMEEEYGPMWHVVVGWDESLDSTCGKQISDNALMWINRNGVYHQLSGPDITHKMVIGHSFATTKAIKSVESRGDRYDAESIPPTSIHKLNESPTHKQELPAPRIRFMTLNEFKDKYGDAWRVKTSKYWIESMDKYFGMPLPKEVGEKMILIGEVKIDQFIFTKDMCIGLDQSYPAGSKARLNIPSPRSRILSEDPSGESVVVDVSSITQRVPRLLY